MIWFTSDTHFGHENIIRLCNRPFREVPEMDEVLISRWNERVRPEDTIYHLGDFTWYDNDRGREIFRRLNGHKHLILGNHDPDHVLGYGWESIADYKVLTIDKHLKFVLFHYPITEHLHFYKNTPTNLKSIHLHGHIHSSPAKPKYKGVNPWALDVGVDNSNFYPLNVEQICKKF